MESIVKIEKTCIECLKKLDISYFNKGRTKCKSCTKLYMKEYYKNKKNIILERSKNYYKENKENLKLYSKNYYHTKKNKN